MSLSLFLGMLICLVTHGARSYIPFLVFASREWRFNGSPVYVYTDLIRTPAAENETLKPDGRVWPAGTTFAMC